MRRVWIICILFIGGIAVDPTPRGNAQTTQRSSDNLVGVKVSGSNRFQPEELLRATGLAVGQPVSEDALKTGADRLASSGMFTDVTYRFFTGPNGTKVEYEVNDVEKLLPAHFDNFVWLSPDQLIAQLQQIEPLFRGQIPNAGDMYQKLANDVEMILRKVNVNATVKVFPEVPPRGGEVFGFKYQVEGIHLPIRAVVFAGASTAMEPVIQKVAQSSLVGRDYSVSAVSSIAKLDLLPQYLSRGFLRAKFEAAAGTLQDPSSGAVSVTLPVAEGISYDLAAVRWVGNTAFSSTELDKALKAPRGKPADRVQLEEDLGAISKVYGTRGYMEVRLDPHYIFDDTARTVSVDVDVKEGPVYHMGELHIEGLAQNAVDNLRKLWRLRPGDVYDTSQRCYFLLQRHGNSI